MKNFKRFLSLVLAFVMLISMTPLTIFAAPASDIPAEMLNNVFLDALEYTGYKVQSQKDEGIIFKEYSNNAPASVHSNISYGTGPSGMETVSKIGTVTDLAPDIANFEANGLCCASYVSYVYYNYLPNIVGIDTSGLPAPTNLRLALAYKNAGKTWIESGKARSISFAQNSDGSGYGKYSYEEFEPADDYEENKTVYECYINDESMMVYDYIENVKIPEPIIPQTGDDSKIGFWIGIAAVAIGGILSCGIIALKSKNGYLDNEDSD